MGKVLTIEINNHDTTYSPQSIAVSKNGELYAYQNPSANNPPEHRRIEYHTRNGRKRFVGFLSNSTGTEKTIFELTE
jgi:hypothetical protein